MICVPPDRARPDLSSILGFDPWGTAPDLAPQGQRGDAQRPRQFCDCRPGCLRGSARLRRACRPDAARGVQRQPEFLLGIRGDGAAAPGRRRSVRPRASPSSRNPTSIPEACSNSAATPRAPSGSMGPSCEMARYRTVLSNLHILRRWRPDWLAGAEGFEPPHQETCRLSLPPSCGRAPDYQQRAQRTICPLSQWHDSSEAFESLRPSQPVRSPTPRMLMSKCELGIGACVRTLVPLDDALELLAQYPGEA
jgi:hypothetical protein